MKALRIALLCALGGIATGAVGSAIGVQALEAHIANQCIKHREARVGQLYFECALAPGWRER